METFAIQIKSTVNDDRFGQGFLSCRHRQNSERFVAALKIFSIFFALAVGFVFVPILHFILVPAALILGGLLAAKNWQKKGLVEKGEVECPNCKKKMTLENKLLTLPMEEVCSHCAYPVKIDKK